MAEPPMAAELRPLLFSIAYRMVGGVTDAEDIVQEAFLRYHQATSDGSEIGSPKAWLSAVTTRLAIDHLGESGGEPRQVVDLPSQHDDIRAAVTWVRGRGDLDPDRVALWGNSLGGAHVISVAADDPGIAAVVAQIPFNGFPRARDRSAAASLRLLAVILWDALRGRLGASPAYIPMIGRPGEVAVISTDEAQRHLGTLAGDAGETRWHNQSVAARPGPCRSARLPP